MDTLEGRTALLTGASSGIGPHIARRLHQEGVRLILSARRRELLETLSRELVGSRVEVADLADRDQVTGLAEAAGPVDILIANAGLTFNGEISQAEPAAIDQVLDVNLRAPIVLSRLLLPGMLARGAGHVVLMASMAGQVSVPRQSLYSTTKFGLRGFGLAIRDELRGSGVGVSLVSPYYVSEAGMFAEAGKHAPGEVSPARVAEAVARAIKHNRAEITVAPLGIRVAARIPMAFPSLARLGEGMRGAGAPPTS